MPPAGGVEAGFIGQLVFDAQTNKCRDQGFNKSLQCHAVTVERRERALWQPLRSHLAAALPSRAISHSEYHQFA